MRPDATNHSVAAPRVLIVEDDAQVAQEISLILEGAGYQVSARVASAAAALELLAGSRPDAVLLDIVLEGDVDGIALAEQIRLHYQIPVLFLTVRSDLAHRARALATDPYAYLMKPVDAQALCTALAMALHNAERDRQLRDNQRWLTAVLSSLHEGVIMADKQGRISALNRAAEVLLGRATEQVAGQPLASVLVLESPAQMRQLEAILTRVIHFAEVMREPLEVGLQGSGGVPRPTAIALAAVTQEQGAVAGVVVSLLDIAAQVDARQRLENLNAELEARVAQRTAALQQASAAKNRFLGEMSHELRTPLIPVVAYSELMALDPSLSADTRSMAREMLASGEHLLGLIGQLLAASENDQPPLKP